MENWQEQGTSMCGSSLRGRREDRTQPGEWRVLNVVYRSRYGYSREVRASSHLFRLRPVHDSLQEVLNHTLVVSPTAKSHEFFDVFDNHAVRAKITEPYRDLIIEARSSVRVKSALFESLETDDLSDKFPVVWMPWQRQQLVPFLLPPELPDSELEVLSRFGMQLAIRHDRNVLETLVALNKEIHNNFKYEPGSTTLATTPFEVFQRKRGVCQDFANLVICVARLLDIPARYRTGYAYNPDLSHNHSYHAWVEMYLPWHGWQGFDPTSGEFASHDHVRVAVGRHYRDAAPVTGAFAGDAKETYEVTVEVTRPEGG